MNVVPPPHKRWWLPDKKDPDDEAYRAAHLIGETAAIESRQAALHELNLWNATLFTNRELIGFRWGAENFTESELWPTNLRTENLIENIGESMVSKASSSPLKPTLVPTGASWETERAVRIADKFVFGVWRQTNAEDACVQMFRDAYMSGGGFGAVRIAYEPVKKSVAVERVFFDNVIIDNRECANGAPPRTIRIRQVLPKAAVEARFGVTLGKQGPYVAYRMIGEEYVVLVEAWRLPDAAGEGGYRMVACGGEIIDEGEWKHDWAPVVFFHWGDRTSGFFVKSGVEQLVPYQVRQNDLNDDIQEAQDICCRPRLTMQANGQIDTSQWDSRQGRFLLWTGNEPKPFEWKTNLNELYMERERNKAAAYSHMGISETFAGADVEQGNRLDSSAGVREQRNREDSRHLRRWTKFEAARMEVAQRIIDVLSVNEGASEFTAVYHPARSKAHAESIPFEALKQLQKDKFSWQMMPTPLSLLAPAARRELLRDWTSRGLISVGSEDAKRMEGHPDLERLEELEMASEDDIDRHIGLMEKGKYEKPTELTNCTLGIRKVTANLHRLKQYEDVDEAVFRLHEKWIAAAASIQVAATMPPEPTPFAPTQGMPGTNATTLPPPPGIA